MGSPQTSHARIAQEFGHALVTGQFERAHQMLNSPARRVWSALSLQNTYEQLVGYFTSPPDFVHIMEEMVEWTGKLPGDTGWAYAAIAGDAESEAVTVIVQLEAGRQVIRSIEWGRP